MKSEDNQPWSSTVIRTVGYGLLILSFFDLVETFYPLQLNNPNWEFRTVGTLAERSPVPLIGIMLVFYGEAIERKKWERLILKIFSFLCLLVGILYILLIPLGLSDIGQLEYSSNVQISKQVSQQLVALQQVEEQANTGITATELSNLVSRLNLQLRLPNSDDANPQRFRSQILAEVDRAKQNVQAQAEISKSQTRTTLFKNSLKWSLSAFVSGALFIRLWQKSYWTRAGKRRKE